MPEPIHDIAAIGHVELLTPDPDGSLRFFHDVLGLDIEAREGQSVFLRGYADYQSYSLKLTEAPQPGLGHVALRAWSDASLERRVAAVEATGLGIGWSDGDHGHGRAYQFTDPDGHLMELYYESERFSGPRESKATLRNTPSPYKPRGCAIPRFDHINMLASDVKAVREFGQNVLGYRLYEQIVADDGSEIGAWMSRSIFSHEVVYVVDKLSRGRLHHIAFWADTREEILRAADVFLDADIYIEAAPSKHTIAQAFFLYGIEPGGNRIELVNGGYFVRDPDWEPVVWSEEERSRGQAWGVQTVESFHTYGTPPLEGQKAPTFGTPAVG